MQEMKDDRNLGDATYGFDLGFGLGRDERGEENEEKEGVILVQVRAEKNIEYCILFKWWLNQFGFFFFVF